MVTAVLFLAVASAWWAGYCLGREHGHWRDVTAKVQRRHTIGG